MTHCGLVCWLLSKQTRLRAVDMFTVFSENTPQQHDVTRPVDEKCNCMYEDWANHLKACLCVPTFCSFLRVPSPVWDAIRLVARWGWGSMVKHQPLQVYEKQLFVSFVTGIYGCRWKRYQRSQEESSRVREYHWSSNMNIKMMLNDMLMKHTNDTAVRKLMYYCSTIIILCRSILTSCP